MPDTIFPSLGVYLATCAILAGAQVVYVLFGFGSGLIAVGGLALLFPRLQDVVVLLLLVNLPAEVLVVAQSHREIRWRPFAGIGAGLLVGIPIGTWLLKMGDPQVVLVMLGWVLVAMGAVFVRLPAGGRIHPPRWLAPPTGMLAGVLTGLFGAGGPPVIVWYHLSAESKSAFRGNLMAVFLMMTCVRVPSYVLGGLVTPVRLASTASVLPAVLAGAWLGHRLHIRIGEGLFRKLVSALVAVLGVMLLVRR